MYRQQLTTLIFITIFTVSVNCFAIQYANKAANEFTPIPVTDPLVIDDVQFVINQINSLSSSKYLVKSIRIKKAFILLKEYVRLTFDLAATKCAKDSQSPLDKCPIDKTKVITIIFLIE